mgnify:FL=1
MVGRSGSTNGNTMTYRADFTSLAQRFNEQMGLEGETNGFSGESDAQHDVVVEEFEEYIEAYLNRDEAGVAEEMADVLVTIFIQADRMGIDINEAYQRKMEYNLQKSGDVDENGKVVDDVEVTKPDFSQMLDG